MNFKYIKRRLTALSYEDRGNVSFKNPDSLKKLVLWLERTTIRKIDPHKREPLTNYGSSDYLANLCEYLSEFDAELDLDPDNWQKNSWVKVIDFLLTQAINAKYADKKTECNAKEPRRKKTTRVFTGCNTEEYKENLNMLCELLQIPPNPNVLTTTRAVSDILCQKYNPSVIKAHNKWLTEQGDNKYTRIQGPEAVCEHYEPEDALGFDTGDNFINAVAIILRMMYIKDLRETQTQLNEVIAALQEFTWDPKTDTSIGKIGRS